MILGLIEGSFQVAKQNKEEKVRFERNYQQQQNQQKRGCVRCVRRMNL